MKNEKKVDELFMTMLLNSDLSAASTLPGMLHFASTMQISRQTTGTGVIPVFYPLTVP